MPTRSPCSFRARARLTAVVDLPTPPLPEATAMMLATPGTPPGRCLASRAAPGLVGDPCWLAAGAPPPPPLPPPGGPGAGAGGGGPGGAVGGERHRDGLHARQGLDGTLRRLAQALELGRALRIHVNGEIDLAL